MARACAICGKTSMGGFNPQSTGMNRVRAHRRYEPNLQKMRLPINGVERHVRVCTRCQRTLQKTA
jgi:large subunit ribosomal protein L28